MEARITNILVIYGDLQVVAYVKDGHDSRFYAQREMSIYTYT